VRAGAAVSPVSQTRSRPNSLTMKRSKQSTLAHDARSIAGPNQGARACASDRRSQLRLGRSHSASTRRVFTQSGGTDLASGSGKPG